MKKHTITAFILASSFLSAAAYAECEHRGHKQGGKNKQGAQHFKMVDANEDGKLSKEEMLNFHENKFTKMDSDGDGFITQDEMKSQMKMNRFMRMDTNNDGVITPDEMSARKDRKNGKGRAQNFDDE